MKVLAAAVSVEGFRRPSGNARRFAVLVSVLARARREHCAFVALPAGFFYARAPDEVAPIVERAREHAVAARVGLVAGVDVRPSGTPRRRGMLAFAVDGKGHVHGPWPQQSRTTHDATDDNAVDVARRTVRFGRHTVAILVCGEMFHPGTRARLAEQRLHLVLDVGHAGLGQGLVPTLQSIAATASAPALHVQHLSGQGGHLHFVDENGRSVPRPVRDALIEGEPWFSTAVREVA
jgi:hypothetical protein